ncbi:spore germination protein [Gottfriedia sp. NPDC057991]|uniref:spore germination protein n=1 Tax=Gottfriedia sp. NPDC057991 TaxID=3346298 RepID=UPI0036DC44E7
MINRNYYAEIINDNELSKHDIKKRELQNRTGKITFLFVNQLTDTTILSDDAIKPLSLLISEKKYDILKAQEVFDLFLYTIDLSIDDQKSKIIEYILQGMTVVIFSNDLQYIVLNTKKNEKRAISGPEITYTVRGARDCFNENLDDNLSLIRYRIKDPKLRIIYLEVGRRTKTKVAIIYIDDIANKKVITEVTNRIKKIDVDGIVSSGELQNLMLNRWFHLFPQTGIVESSDLAGAVLLEGKVLVLADGSGLGIIAPKVFLEFFASGDDLFDNSFMAVFLKWIRLLSGFISVSITSLYVAILSFHIDALPIDFINSISNYSQQIPFSIFVEAFILELLVVILREAMIRVPKQIGSAVGVLVSIVIGQAAIIANIFNPLLLIIVAVGLVTTFAIPDYTLSHPLRLLRFFFLFASATFGLIGFTLALTIVLTNLVSTNSFGVPYFSPLSPFNWKDLRNLFFFRRDMSNSRPNFLRNKDKTRS